MSAAGPGDPVREYAYAAQVFSRVGFLDGLGCETGGEKKKQKSAHAMIVPEVHGRGCTICIVGAIFGATRERHVTGSAGNLLWRD